ncbi:MAG: DUF6640 family protein [Pseudomonadota bacterium]
MIGKALLTLTALIYAVLPPIVDFNASHAVHPDWTGHARFHMVWLVGANSFVGLFAIYQIWMRADRGGPVIAGILSAIVLGSFFLAALTMPLYDGALVDPGGVEVAPGGIDANLFLFSIGFAINAVGLFLAAWSKAS